MLLPALTVVVPFGVTSTVIGQVTTIGVSVRQLDMGLGGQAGTVPFRACTL